MPTSSERILMVMDSMGTGGTETHVLSLGKALRSSGVQLFYSGADGPFYRAFADAGFRLHLIEQSNEPLPMRREKQQQTFRDIIKEENISIVHVHQTPSGLLAAEAAAELGVPIVFTMHGTYYPVDEAVSLAQRCDAMISVSKPVQSFWKKHGVESTVISNGVDLQEFETASTVNLRETTLSSLPQDAFVVTYVSRLAWQKASVCNMLLRSTKTLNDIPNLHIVVVGTGAQSHFVQELAQALNKLKGYPYVHIAGEQTDVKPYYEVSDLVVGTGRVALEAMACRKPVLAIGNHGYVGLVTPDIYDLAWEYYFGDHQSVGKPSPGMIAEALRKAFADRHLLQSWGEQGKDWVRSRFDIRQKSEELLAFYSAVRSKKKGGGTT